MKQDCPWCRASLPYIDQHIIAMHIVGYRCFCGELFIDVFWLTDHLRREDGAIAHLISSPAARALNQAAFLKAIGAT